MTRTPGYVAAPIMIGRRVIGFLHADRIGQRAAVSAGDLECIAFFATEFSLLFERAVLAERVERIRTETEAAWRRAAADLDAGDHAFLGLQTVAPKPGHPPPVPAPRRDALLTAREREVVELMATGATNHAVARELVVSPDTVKTHVSSILRKLGASTRADAVARYLRLQTPDEQPARSRPPAGRAREQPRTPPSRPQHRRADRAARAKQAARGCGLRRVLLSRVRDGVWSPWKLYDDHDVEVPVAAVAFDTALVQQALRRLWQWEGFIVAPIAPAGEPLGLFHADPIDDDSRELLSEFANSFGRIYERTAMRDHLDAHRGRLLVAAAEVEAISDESHREIDLVRLVGSERPAEASTETFDERSDPPDDALTPRERDVFALMRQGYSNAQIADRLAVQPSTVKSHVRAILRKLGAVNRVEAIAVYPSAIGR